jgi:hypothetical protein
LKGKVENGIASTRELINTEDSLEHAITVPRKDGGLLWNGHASKDRATRSVRTVWRFARTRYGRVSRAQTIGLRQIVEASWMNVHQRSAVAPSKRASTEEALHYTAALLSEIKLIIEASERHLDRVASFRTADAAPVTATSSKSVLSEHRALGVAYLRCGEFAEQYLRDTASSRGGMLAGQHTLDVFGRESGELRRLGSVTSRYSSGRTRSSRDFESYIACAIVRWTGGVDVSTSIVRTA